MSILSHIKASFLPVLLYTIPKSQKVPGTENMNYTSSCCSSLLQEVTDCLTAWLTDWLTRAFIHTHRHKRPQQHMQIKQNVNTLYSKWVMCSSQEKNNKKNKTAHTLYLRELTTSTPWLWGAPGVHQLMLRECEVEGLAEEWRWR